MSSFSQLVAVLLFLCYSTGYMMFVAWASARTSKQKTRLRPVAGILILGMGIGLPLAGLCFLLRT